MGGRGGSSGFSITSQLKSMQAKGQFPSAIFGDREKQAEAFMGINAVYDYPEDLKQYMQEHYANGLPKVRLHETEPGRVYATFNSSTIGINYPLGKTDAETAKIKAGAEKFLFINHWNKVKKNER